MKVKSESEVAQSCPTLRDSMDSSLPGSFVHGIFQARVLECGAFAFSVTLDSRLGLLLKDKLTQVWFDHLYASQVAPVVKNLTANAGNIKEAGLIPGWKDPLQEGRKTQFQYSCLENPMDRGDWQATVHGVAKSRT